MFYLHISISSRGRPSTRHVHVAVNILVRAAHAYQCHIRIAINGRNKTTRDVSFEKMICAIILSVCLTLYVYKVIKKASLVTSLNRFWSSTVINSCSTEG